MVFFTIALRSKASTNNWEKVVANFNNTLNSIFNQTSESFAVYVACNDLPDLYADYDERLNIVQVNTPKPNSWIECCRDRAWKQLVCAHSIYNSYSTKIESGGYFSSRLMQMII